MKKYIAIIAVLFALLISPLPYSFSFAAQGVGGSSRPSTSGTGSSEPAGSGQGDQLQTQDRDQIKDPSTHDGDEPDQDRTQLQIQDKDQTQIFLHTTNPATSNDSLRNTIQQREREMEQFISSSTSDSKYANVVRNENQVRSAVQSLLDSRNLLKGIGPQVSEIAQQIGVSQASTTEAEKNTVNRGFLARFLFGGDKQSAEVINREVLRNQERIKELHRLIGDNASTTDELKIILREQIQLIEQEQERLRTLADKELGQWGIFSWRF